MLWFQVRRFQTPCVDRDLVHSQQQRPGSVHGRTMAWNHRHCCNNPTKHRGIQMSPVAWVRFAVLERCYQKGEVRSVVVLEVIGVFVGTQSTRQRLAQQKRVLDSREFGRQRDRRMESAVLGLMAKAIVVAVGPVVKVFGVVRMLAECLKSAQFQVWRHQFRCEDGACAHGVRHNCWTAVIRPYRLRFRVRHRGHLLSGTPEQCQARQRQAS